MGLFTLVGENASTLSMGQRQLILIERALVSKPKILIFDEATSSLDNQTQKIVIENLKHLKATRIVIAHRLSAIEQCDRILLMDKGQLVDIGTYQELMERSDLFAELFRCQLV